MKILFFSPYAYLTPHYIPGAAQQYFELVYDLLYKNTESMPPNTLQSHIYDFIMKKRMSWSEN